MSDLAAAEVDAAAKDPEVDDTAEKPESNSDPTNDVSAALAETADGLLPVLTAGWTRTAAAHDEKGGADNHQEGSDESDDDYTRVPIKIDPPIEKSWKKLPESLKNIGHAYSQG